MLYSHVNVTFMRYALSLKKEPFIIVLNWILTFVSKESGPGSEFMRMLKTKPCHNGLVNVQVDIIMKWGFMRYRMIKGEGITDETQDVR